jgi:hypothetical protein
MKTKVTFLKIILIVLAFYTQAKAQDYVPLAVDGAHWLVVKRIHVNPTPFDAIWEYYANGNTVVEGQTYLNVYRRELELNAMYLPPFYPATAYELVGLLREDFEERKVYTIFSGCGSDEESLLFDFSLSVGDTASFCTVNEAAVTAIEEVTYLGMETREFAALRYNIMYISFFEGIGSGHGLFEEMFTPVKSQDNSSLYSTSLRYYCRETPCDFIVSTEELRETAPLVIHPNPATTETWLQLPENITLENARVELYSPTGRQLYKAQPTSYFHKIETANLPKGLYLVRLWNGEKWMVEKLVVR